MSETGHFIGRQAVVIGASMGGLLAARVLADHYARVIVLERDAMPPAGENRKGVPQGRHTHGLLARGGEILEELFPGLTAELIDQGAIPFDQSINVSMIMKGSRHLPTSRPIPGIGVSRPRLEAQVRTRLLTLPNVTLVEECAVRDLLTDAAGRRVTGVRVTWPGTDRALADIPADLVVDASGRGSRMPAWLAALGFPQPEEDQLGVDLTYTTRVFRRRPHHLNGDNIVLIGPTAESKRMGIILAQDKESWIVTLGGYFGDAAPADPQGFAEFARRLAGQEIYQVVRNAEPLSDFRTFKYPASRRRLYEKLSRFPEGLLVFGDAICSFNPIYGQGMTVAAIEATVLRECLTAGAEALAPRFFKGAGRVVDMVWSIIMDDLNFPETEGKRTTPFRIISWYMDRVHVAAARDPEVALAFARVANLLAAPPSLLQPRIAWRVLRANRRAPRSGGLLGRGVNQAPSLG